MTLFRFIAVGIAVHVASLLMGQNAADIMSKADYMAYHQGQTFRTNVSMVIVDRKGRERHRQMIMLRLNDKVKEGQQKYFVYFKKPMDLYKMVFMVWKHANRSDDRWMYLPAADLVKRIAGSDGRASFAGSHFVYEDVSGRGIDKDTHEVVDEDDQHLVIRSTPRRGEKSEFIYKLTWIDRSTLVPMKVKYFDASETNYRTYSVLEVEEVDGFATVLESVMENNIEGSKTRLSFSEIAYNGDVPENIFTERFLRRPPLEYLLQ